MILSLNTVIIYFILYSLKSLTIDNLQIIFKIHIICMLKIEIMKKWIWKTIKLIDVDAHQRESFGNNKINSV